MLHKNTDLQQQSVKNLQRMMSKTQQEKIAAEQNLATCMCDCIHKLRKLVAWYGCGQTVINQLTTGVSGKLLG